MDVGDVFMAVYLVVFWFLVFAALMFKAVQMIGDALGRRKTSRTVNQSFVVSGKNRMTPRQIERLRSIRGMG